MAALKHTFYYFIVGLLLIPLSVYGQPVEISGVVNNSSPVTELLQRRAGSNVNAVKVTEPDTFSVGDVVVLYVSKGWHLITSGVDEDIGKASDVVPHPNVGGYSINRVDSILMPDSIIVFVAPTPFDTDLTEGESAQLVRVPYYQEEVVVSGTLRGQEWSEAKGEGGVIALFVEGKLTLEADIDATGIGFEGADPSADNYEGACYDDNPTLYGRNFYLTTNDDIAGLKGEGAVVSTFNDSLRGKKPIFNGGGGGNAKFSGGGGGSNYSPGGAGGAQSEECAVVEMTSGEGGHGLGDEYYYNYVNFATPLANHIYFGGGGGASTQTSTALATAGGDGGGIVIIIADTIEADNSVAIRANGANVTGVATAGGGGGGGGGCIVIDVNHYKGEVQLEARGGEGGDTQNSFYTGPGGGGGGGIYWLNRDSTNVIPDYTPGESGVYRVDPNQSPAENGVKANLLTGLLPPLNGFLFNTLPNDRTVCTDEVPDTLFASTPKGGLVEDPDPYTYKWHFKRPADADWDSLAVGDDDQYYVFKAPLSEPLQLRRIVRSGGLEEGYDVFVTYSVTNKLEGNVIKSPDVICSGLTAEPLIQDDNFTLQGADIPTDTSFRWIKTVDGGTNWQDADGNFEKKDFTPSGITENTSYSRIVYSGVCDDTSNMVLITVLPTITGNTIEDSDTICLGQMPGIFSGGNASNGDGTYTYVWQVSNDLTTWGDSLVSSANQNFSLSAYNETKYIRRVIYSGEDSACVDVSEADTITVLDPVDNNTVTLTADTITVCQYDELPEGGVNGSPPGGGDGTYSYEWQVKTESTNWTAVSDVPPETKFNLSSIADTTFVRRQVISGSDDVCVSISDTLVLGVVWEIQDNLITTEDATYCQDDQLPEIVGQTATGGANGIDAQWQYKTETGDWQIAPGANSGWNYHFPERIYETLSFRRMTWSEPVDSVCVDYSDTLKITVQDSILQNQILFVNDAAHENYIDSVCAGLDLNLNGSDGTLITGGDETNYNYFWDQSQREDFSVIDSSSTGINYVKENFRDSAFFRRIIISGECEDTTSTLIYPIELPTGKLDYADNQPVEVCASTALPVQLEVEPQLDPLAKNYTAYVSYASEERSGDNSFFYNNTSSGIIGFSTETDSVETYIYVLDSIVDDRNCKSEILDPFNPQIKVYYSPEATITATAAEVCGPDVELTATNKGGVSFTWKAITADPAAGESFAEIDDDGLFANAALKNWFNDTAVVDYWFKIETSGGLGMACADSNSVRVIHYEPPASLPYFVVNDVNDLGDSIAIDSVYFADNYQLSVDYLSDAGKGEWSVQENSYGLLGEDPFSPVMVAGLDDQLDVDNIFVWTVSNGVCQQMSDEFIIRRKDVEVYEGISPNGDGYNDVLAMRGIKNAEKIQFTVFNSWGTPIFKMTEANEEQFVSLLPNDPNSEELRVLWDGKVGGSVVPDGTYYYIITFKINVGTPREKEYSKKSYLVVSTQQSQ